jgi:hypothetical protein
MGGLAHDGIILFNLIVAGVMTLVLGSIALLVLQRAILRNMLATAGPGAAPPPAERPRRGRRGAAGVRGGRRRAGG